MKFLNVVYAFVLKIIIEISFTLIIVISILKTIESDLIKFTLDHYLKKTAGSILSNPLMNWYGNLSLRSRSTYEISSKQVTSRVALC